MAVFRKPTFSLGNYIHPGINTFLILCLLIGGFVLFSANASAATPAEQGQTIFEQKCKSCHTIGGGRLVGPDLKDATASRDRDWLARFITAPDKLIAQGDPIASKILQEYGLPMPNLGMTRDEVEALLAYLESRSSAPQTGLSAAQTAAVIKGDAETGRSLFTGEMALTNNGPACLSCHNISGVGVIGGGTAGKDLTGVYSVAGETVIRSLLRSLPYTMMREVFIPKPLTDTEIAHLLAFLKSASNTPPGSYQNQSLFLIVGVVGALVIIGLFQLLWRGRLAGVRRPLVKGGSK